MFYLNLSVGKSSSRLSFEKFTQMRKLCVSGEKKHETNDFDPPAAPAGFSAMMRCIATPNAVKLESAEKFQRFAAAETHSGLRAR